MVFNLISLNLNFNFFYILNFFLVLKKIFLLIYYWSKQTFFSNKLQLIYWMPTMVGDPQGPMLDKFGICIKDMIGSCRPGFNPRYRQNFSVGIFQDLSTLKNYNWIVSMVKSDLKDNRSPGTVACAVIPRLGRLALWMIGLVPRL